MATFSATVKATLNKSFERVSRTFTHIANCPLYVFTLSPRIADSRLNSVAREARKSSRVHLRPCKIIDAGITRSIRSKGWPESPKKRRVVSQHDQGHSRPL